MLHYCLRTHHITIEFDFLKYLLGVKFYPINPAVETCKDRLQRPGWVIDFKLRSHTRGLPTPNTIRTVEPLWGINTCWHRWTHVWFQHQFRVIKQTCLPGPCLWDNHIIVLSVVLTKTQYAMFNWMLGPMTWVWLQMKIQYYYITTHINTYWGIIDMERLTADDVFGILMQIPTRARILDFLVIIIQHKPLEMGYRWRKLYPWGSPHVQ